MTDILVHISVLGRLHPEFQPSSQVNDQLSLDGDTDLPLEHTPRQRQRPTVRHRRLGVVAHSQNNVIMIVSIVTCVLDILNCESRDVT